MVNWKTIARVALVSILVAGTLAVIYFATHRGAEPEVVATPEPQPPTIEALFADCPAACEKMIACGKFESQEKCLTVCLASYPGDLRDCIVSSECEELMNACFTISSDECLDVCDRMELCGYLPWDECLRVCHENTEPTTIDCINNEDTCEGIEEYCLDAFNKGAVCRDYCDRMIECGHFDSSARLECLDLCQTEEQDRIDCVFVQECDDIMDICFDPEMSPACSSYCAKIDDCGMNELLEDDCALVCRDAQRAHIGCVQEAGCDELPWCFEADWAIPDCREYCRKLVECGEYDWQEFPLCLQDCRQEPLETLLCVLEESCSDIEVLCMRTVVDEACALSCEVMFECGLMADPDLCFSICLDAWEMWTMDCVVGSQCEEIDPFCFDPLAYDCRDACDRLYACGLSENAGLCINQCYASWNDTTIDCALGAPCETMGEECFGVENL